MSVRIADGYDPRAYYQRQRAAARVIDARQHLFAPATLGLFTPIYQLLHYGDEYFHLADCQAYVDIQDKLGRDFKNASWPPRDAQHGPRRQILQRSHDRRIRPRHLAREGGMTVTVTAGRDGRDGLGIGEPVGPV